MVPTSLGGGADSQVQPVDNTGFPAPRCPQQPAGGATDTVQVNGLQWFMAGGTTAVRELRAALLSGSVT
jgi:hypothetical protein